MNITVWLINPAVVADAILAITPKKAANDSIVPVNSGAIQSVAV